MPTYNIGQAINVDSLPPEMNPLLSDLKEIPSMTIEDYTLHLDIGDMPEDVREKARRELRETPELQKQSMEELKRMIRDEKDLIAPIDNDAWLIRFLRPCKYYPESALQLVKNYYGYKQKNAYLFEDPLPSSQKKVFEHDLLTVLPRRDQEGRRVLVLFLGKRWKHKEVQLDEILKGAILFVELAMLEPWTQVCGASVILDLEGLSLQQTWQFTPPFCKRIIDLLQDSVALRVKGIHIVNQPYVFNVVYQLFKPLLREKLKSRLYFHGTDRKSLQEHFEPWVLPEFYGGTLDVPNFHCSKWIDVLTAGDKEYKKINEYGYKNVEKPKKK